MADDGSSKTRARFWLWGSVLLVGLLSMVAVHIMEQMQNAKTEELRILMDASRKAEFM